MMVYMEHCHIAIFFHEKKLYNPKDSNLAVAPLHYFYNSAVSAWENLFTAYRHPIYIKSKADEMLYSSHQTSLCLRPVPKGRFSAGLAAESAVELANSVPESSDSTTYFVIVCQLPVLNMFNISIQIQSKDSSRPNQLLPSVDCKSV